MKPFTRLTAVAAPLRSAERRHRPHDPGAVSPEPAERRLRPVLLSRSAHPAGRHEDPEFVLNRPAYQAAEILVAAENFGCGSSREGAVWALAGRGIRAVVAPSFGDIFHENCLRNGLLPVRLPAAVAARLRQAIHAAPGATLTIDLPAQTVTGPEGLAHGFEIDAFRKQALLEGLDDIGLTLRHDAEIEAFEGRHAVDWPWAGPVRLPAPDATPGASGR